ncbi:MAG: DUF1223 domain-containing protein [Parvularculaceae bacterium]
MVRKSACAAVGGMVLMSGACAAQAEIDPAKPVVVEMFLSQSCKSSPPAAKHLSDIARREDIVALAWHVDYWNEAPGYETAAWADPFARSEFSARHKAYNLRLRRSSMVKTPQAVIDGVFVAAGSKREAVEARITEARFIDEHARGSTPRLELLIGKEDTIRVRIDRIGAPYDAYAVTFRPKAVTEVSGGDNAGSTFDETNVVTGVKTLATAAEGPRTLSFQAPDDGEDCAVIVQERGLGRIVAARYCAGRLTN